MRSLSYFFLSIFILGSVFSASLNAQTENPSDAPISIPEGAVLVASVGISDAKIISMEGNEINFTFSFSNAGEQQSGVKYGVQLIKEENKSGNIVSSIVDEHIYDESLILSNGAKVVKTITYKAPEYLDGVYSLNIVSKNSTGFPFGSQRVGEVFLQSKKTGVTILTETCTVESPLNENPKDLPFSLGVSIVSSEVDAKIKCTLLNSSDTEQIIRPEFITYKDSIYGEKIKAQGGSVESVAIPAKEQKEVSFALPKADNPGSYAVSMIIKSQGIESSVSTQYVFVGKSASISNFTLDKTSYKKGENAEVKILWSSSEESVSIELSIKGKYFSCGKTKTETITKDIQNPISTISFPIKNKCSDPKVTLKIKDSENNVLDQKTISFDSDESFSVNRRTTIIIISVIALIAITGVLLNKKNKNIE